MIGKSGKSVSANVVVIIQKDKNRVTYKIVTVYLIRKENKTMKELDTVKLIKDFNELPIGTKGAIVSEYDGTYYEVEFLTQMVIQLVFILPHVMH